MDRTRGQFASNRARAVYSRHALLCWKLMAEDRTRERQTVAPGAKTPPIAHLSRYRLGIRLARRVIAQL